MKSQSMVVAGVMSGTSADGVDVALTRIAPRRNNTPSIELLAHEHFSYPPALRRAVLSAMNAHSISAAELARLNWRLGEVYAEAVVQTISKTIAKHKVKVDLIGCHGQTIYHQGKQEKYLGRPLRCTWQLGEPALIAERNRTPVVSNFRAIDMAVGGQGAPLVPMLDYVLFRDTKRNRILQNLGGIGNLTVLPAGATAEEVFAFDTGPANMVIDACMQRLYGRPYDRNGAVAANGWIIRSVVTQLLRDPYFTAKPPKSAGREQFGEAYVARFLKLCKAHKAQPGDIIATATALTAWSISATCKRFVLPKLANRPTDFIVSGGGTRNTTLMTMLELSLGFTVLRSDDLGLPSQAKEAAAFALLAWLTWHGLPGNIPSATGAKRTVILGSITYA